ncbi:hypothetical protein CLOP_g10793 [Closterium sp. NIES-67]|nr:hypothetical protein CLOP_g10793 [Closterium sp. NIES-67]
MDTSGPTLAAQSAARSMIAFAARDSFRSDLRSDLRADLPDLSSSGSSSADAAALPADFTMRSDSTLQQQQQLWQRRSWHLEAPLRLESLVAARCSDASSVSAAAESGGSASCGRRQQATKKGGVAIPRARTAPSRHSAVGGAVNSDALTTNSPIALDSWEASTARLLSRTRTCAGTAGSAGSMSADATTASPSSARRAPLNIRRGTASSSRSGRRFSEDGTAATGYSCRWRRTKETTATEEWSCRDVATLNSSSSSGSTGSPCSILSPWSTGSACSTGSSSSGSSSAALSPGSCGGVSSPGFFSPTVAAAPATSAPPAAASFASAAGSAHPPLPTTPSRLQRSMTSDRLLILQRRSGPSQSSSGSGSSSSSGVNRCSSSSSSSSGSYSSGSTTADNSSGGRLNPSGGDPRRPPEAPRHARRHSVSFMERRACDPYARGSDAHQLMQLQQQQQFQQPRVSSGVSPASSPVPVYRTRSSVSVRNLLPTTPTASVEVTQQQQQLYTSHAVSPTTPPPPVASRSQRRIVRSSSVPARDVPLPTVSTTSRPEHTSPIRIAPSSTAAGSRSPNVRSPSPVARSPSPNARSPSPKACLSTHHTAPDVTTATSKPSRHARRVSFSAVVHVRRFSDCPVVDDFSKLLEQELPVWPVSSSSSSSSSESSPKFLPTPPPRRQSSLDMPSPETRRRVAKLKALNDWSHGSINASGPL